MAYYYVKSGGTATGDGGRSATQRTGTWNASTADYYNDLYDLVSTATTRETDGDIICVSDLHAYTGSYADVVILNDTGSFSGAGVKVISVDDANQENYKPGASEYQTGTKTVRAEYNVLIAGVSLGNADDTITVSLSGTNLVLQDLTLVADSSADLCMKLFADGCQATLINVTLVLNSVSAEYFFINSGCRVYWYGGSVTGFSPGELVTGGGNGGVSLHIEGVDLSGFTGVLGGSFTAGISDAIDIDIINCQLNSSASLPTPTAQMQNYQLMNSDDSTGGTFHRFYHMNGVGTAKNNDSIYVTANQPWNESSDKSSIAVTTTSQCCQCNPFIFKYPARYVELATGVSDTVSINLLTEGTLNDNDIAFFLCYPDGTTEIQANWISSAAGSASYTLDPLATGSELNTTGALGASDWTGEDTLTSPKYYKVNLDTSVDAGSASAPSLRVEVYKEIDGTTGNKLYIDPILTVGT